MKYKQEYKSGLEKRSLRQTYLSILKQLLTVVVKAINGKVTILKIIDTQPELGNDLTLPGTTRVMHVHGEAFCKLK